MSIFCNNVTCDIYIGKGAGKKLMEDIRNAKRNVKIVSPYLSPYLITELISLHSRGIDIQLITNDEIEDFNDREKNIHRLIIQNKNINIKDKQKRDHLIKLSKNLLAVILLATMLVFVFLFLIQKLEIAYSFIIIGLMFFIRNSITEKIKNKRIYYYKYSQLFPFKVFVSKYYEKSPFNKNFIHSKIYIIDNEIAYLGSLNFTGSGVKANHETRIRTTDQDAVKSIKDEVEELFSNINLAERDVQSWGSQLYDEPIN